MGIFFRENVDANVTVLTPWPGSVGYLSRMDVRDLRGRTTILPGEERLRSWHRPGRVDIVEALKMKAEYIIPTSRPTKTPPTPLSLAESWVAHLDNRGNTNSIWAVLRQQYELVTVPLPSPSRISSKRLHGKGYILRHKDSSQAPKLHLETDGQSLIVTCTHEGHGQLADLRLTIKGPEENKWDISPTGVLSQGRTVLARRELLLTRTGGQAMELMRLELPSKGWSGKSIQATLINPGAQGLAPFSRVSVTETLQLP